MDNSALISIDAVQEIDSEIFVGRVLVGDVAAYQTVSGYPAADQALRATAYLMASVLGPRLAGQEWRMLNSDLRHAPRRSELSAADHTAEDRSLRQP